MVKETFGDAKCCKSVVITGMEGIKHKNPTSQLSSSAVLLAIGFGNVMLTFLFNESL